MSGELQPIRAGLVGAGPWAAFVHAPLLAGHPDLAFECVWARRLDAAADIARVHGTEPVDELDELVERCEIVVFAVPPSVQADLAVPAALAGRTLLVEKPLAGSIDAAMALRDAAEHGGARTVFALTWRWNRRLDEFLDAIAAGPPPIRATARFRSGAALGGPFATPWRVDDGALLDLGPHVIDLLERALGRIVEVAARRTPDGDVDLLLAHESGATSTASLSITADGDTGSILEIESTEGVRTIDPGAGVDAALFRRLGDTLVAVHRGAATPVDVHRGVRIQQMLDAAARQLADHP